MHRYAQWLIAIVHFFRPPVRWVVLDDDGSVFDVARTERQVVNLALELGAMGSLCCIQLIGNRCTSCGENVTPFPAGADYPHAPECPQGDDGA